MEYAGFFPIFSNRYTNEPHDLLDYWTEVHKIFIVCRSVHCTVNAPIKYSNPFQNSSLLNEGKSDNLASKLVAKTISFEVLEKEIHIHDIQ